MEEMQKQFDNFLKQYDWVEKNLEICSDNIKNYKKISPKLLRKSLKEVDEFRARGKFLIREIDSYMDKHGLTTDDIEEYKREQEQEQEY